MSISPAQSGPHMWQTGGLIGMPDHPLAEIAEKPDEKQLASDDLPSPLRRAVRDLPGLCLLAEDSRHEKRTLCLPIRPEILSADRFAARIGNCLRQLHVVTPEWRNSMLAGMLSLPGPAVSSNVAAWRS